jgi:hypothetical protein
MLNNLYATLRSVLFRRWNERLPGILAAGSRVESSGMTVADGYAEGYRTAYFDAVSDMLEAGLVRNPSKRTPTPPHPRLMLSDEVH